MSWLASCVRTPPGVTASGGVSGEAQGQGRGEGPPARHLPYYHYKAYSMGLMGRFFNRGVIGEILTPSHQGVGSASMLSVSALFALLFAPASALVLHAPGHPVAGMLLRTMPAPAAALQVRMQEDGAPEPPRGINVSMLAYVHAHVPAPSGTSLYHAHLPSRHITHTRMHSLECA